MTFQSKRLRLQLPCAETPGHGSADDAAPVAAHPTRDHAVRAADSLGPFAGDPWPDLGGAGHDEFETVLVTPQQLAVLRRRLEARLAPATGAQG